MKRELIGLMRKGLTAFLFVCCLGLGMGKSEPVKAGVFAGVANLHQTGSTDSYFGVEWDKDVNAYGYEFSYSADGSIWSDGQKTTSLAYYINSVNSGKTYYVKVRSLDKNAYYNYENPQYSDWCKPIEVVTEPDRISNIKQTDGDSSSISVAWEAADGAAKYQVYYELGGSKFLAGEVTKPSCKVKGLDPDKRYDIYVYAVRKSPSGYEAISDGTDHVCYTVAGKIKGLTFDKWNTVDNTVNVSWTDNESYNTGYEVCVSNLSGKKVKNFSVTYAQADFSVKSIKNKGCVVKVRAYRDVDGVEIYGKWSDSKVIIPQPKVTVSRKNSKAFNLRWSKISGATSYTVYRSKSYYTGFKKVKTTKANSITDAGLSADTTYYYYVIANGIKVKNATGKSTKPVYREIAYCGWRDVTEYTYQEMN